MNDEVNKSIMQALEDLRRRLLDIGTRHNRLLHVNRKDKRANCLNVTTTRIDDIYHRLRNQTPRTNMKFKAAENDAEQSAILEDNDNDMIETQLEPTELSARLLRIASDARIAEEDQGINALYLAMGFLCWKESESSKMLREAPLVLLPVQLVRNGRTSTYDIKCRDDDIESNLPLQERLKQDFGIKLPDIKDIDGWKPSDYFSQISDMISEISGWSVDTDGMQLGQFSFAQLLMYRDLDLGKWPAKDSDGQPTNLFLAEPLLRCLLTGKEHFQNEESIFDQDVKLDQILEPSKIVHIIDADASQTKVIEDVRHGKSMVVRGPPGTGKSQTITNIIATAVHDGKSVLFVAEKMPALEVVYKRLVGAGLGDICFELHSKKANRKKIVQELNRTLTSRNKKLDYREGIPDLRKVQDELNRIDRLLHEHYLNDADTPFQALSEYIGFSGKEVNIPKILLDGLDKVNHDQRSAALDAIDGLVNAYHQIGSHAEHPFRSIGESDLQPNELQRLETDSKHAINLLDELDAEASRIAELIKQSKPRSFADIQQLVTVLKLLNSAPTDTTAMVSILIEHTKQPRLSEALASGREWAEAKNLASLHFNNAAWQIDAIQINQIRINIKKGKDSWFSRYFGGYRNASKKLAALLSGDLPRSLDDRLQFIEMLRNEQQLRHKFSDDEGWLMSILDSVWRGERTPFAIVYEIANWLSTLQDNGISMSAKQIIDALEALGAYNDSASIPDQLAQKVQNVMSACEMPIDCLKLDLMKAVSAPSLQMSVISHLSNVFSQMTDNMSRYNDWIRFERAISRARATAADRVVDAIIDGSLKPSDARAEFSFACTEARWKSFLSVYPELKELNHIERHNLVNRFQELVETQIEETKKLILSKHSERMHQNSATEMGLIRSENARKRGRHMSIRQIMSKAGSAVQKIKPVLLMSPMSVAQFLPPGDLIFDILVIDEASQVRPEHALGAVARANQIVIVGDQKQLPPSDIFSRISREDENNDEESARPADMESILSLCEARYLPHRTLEWHYRSRDPSLIQKSNEKFYGNNLVLPPSPLQHDPNYGLKFRRVAGIYARGKSAGDEQGKNHIEAEAVIDAIADHARVSPTFSLGVVTFSIPQADKLTELLEERRREDNILDKFLQDGESEDTEAAHVFIKSIENVQGDERDVIMISISYGPQEPNGRLPSMDFGAINKEGGERRLNVLFTRAKFRCEVFASFDPGDIEEGRVIHDGPKILKEFLEYAKTGFLKTDSTGEAESPFEEDVAEVIKSLGFKVDLQVKSSGFRIDIGVHNPNHPGQYLIAVECDGASYHSALWARERDRQRQRILEERGWHFHRIWSTDWFYRREAEIERLRNSLEQALKVLDKGIYVKGSNTASVITNVAEEFDAGKFDAEEFVDMLTRAISDRIAGGNMNCVAISRELIEHFGDVCVPYLREAYQRAWDEHSKDNNNEDGLLFKHLDALEKGFDAIRMAGKKIRFGVVSEEVVAALDEFTIN